MALLAPSVATRTVSLEALVRPYTNGPVQGSRTRFYNGAGSDVSEPTSEPVEGILAWKWTAPVQVTTIDALGYDFKLDMGEEQYELSRETHLVRVFSEDDPDAYIDTDVIDRLVLKNYKSGVQAGINLTNPE